MRLVLLSDTHNQLNAIRIPDGDILIHAGDLTNRGTLKEVVRELAVFAALPHKRKILVAGNHDWLFERDGALARSLCVEFDYLQNSSVVVDGVTIWGSPVQPEFCNWAFNRQRGVDIKRYWDIIPDGVDVLVTHGPPAGYGDLCPDGRRVGCTDLLDAVTRTKPRLHVFGHIHCARGLHVGRGPCSGTDFINAACVGEDYRVVAEQPMVYDL